MNAFDTIIQKVIDTNSDFAVLRPVVEKEVLHHDILRIINENDYLSKLVFMGGTCLRMCYGSSRLSGDLDFTGDFDFTKETLTDFSKELKSGLEKKIRFGSFCYRTSQGNWKYRHLEN